MDFILATDSNCDLARSFIEENNIHLFSLTVNLDGKEFPDDLGKSYNYQDFYNKMRNGSMPTTSQVNSYTFKERFEAWAKEGIPVLYVAFSSALSGTYSSSMTAREEVLEEYPSASITIIDTLCASGGQGFLLYHAAEMKKQGKSLDEIVAFIEEMKHKIFHIFTVDDLHHLARGGRLKPAAAFLGNMLQIKPILYLGEEGTLIAYQKARGRKKALKTLLEHYDKYKAENSDTVFISHGDCLEDAEYLASELKSSYHVKEVVINQIGTAIGSHTGANVIALFFFATTKSPESKSI